VQVAAVISTAVTNNVSSQLSVSSGNDAQANMQAAANVITGSVFSGLKLNADWWQQVRNKATDVIEFRAYALYIIDAKSLNQQVAAYLQNFVDDKNEAMSEAEKAIYGKLIEDIMNNTGVELNG
jgi:hypothetical protein